MKWLLMMLIGVLGVGSLALGQATTMPAGGQAALDQPVKVLIIPFTQIGDHGHEWVGAAIHENLVTQASANSALQVIGMRGTLPENSPQAAVSAAKGTNATLVVFGSFQFAGDQLRVNGRVVETNYGQTIGTLNATGPIIDLFKIEDTLSTQMGGALPQAASNLPTVTYGPPQQGQLQTAQQPVYPQQDQAVQPDQQPVPYYAGNSPDQSGAVAAQAPTYVYAPTYTSGYSYPYYPYTYSPYYYGYGYGYPYWGWGGGIVIVNRGAFCGPGWGGWRGGSWGGWRGGSWNGWHGGSWGGHPGTWGGHSRFVAGGFHNGGFAGGGFHGGGFGGGGFHGGGMGMGGFHGGGMGMGGFHGGGMAMGGGHGR